MLAVFPENYRLYEHVKRTVKDGKTEVKSKMHAGGGNDRQDAYLYGHPTGRKKRFRSPIEFFPHLLWLCTDESGDPENCTCKICSPEELDPPAPVPRVKGEKASSRVDPEPRLSASSAAPSASRPMSAQTTRTKTDGPTPATRPPAPKQPVPTPMPPAKSSDQQLDRRYNVFMYRPGELVWFKRGAAWGLGVVLRRWTAPSQPYHYTVQPLSYPYRHPPAVVKSSDQEMRPWLAWSVPKFTNDGLNSLTEPAHYDSADWHGMEQRRYGSGDMEVDGSILAAKAIDTSYTLLQPLKSSNTDPGVVETHYNGIFLGAEKFWIGEPVRISIGTGTDILVLHSIVERKRGSPGQSSLHFVGDIYTLSSAAHSNPQIPSPAAQANNPQLPSRLTDDLANRNARSIPNKRTASYWKLLSTNTQVSLDDVKGRWYEASLLLPILQPEQYEAAARKGEIQEASLWMNSRGDCVNSNRSPSLPRVTKTNVKRATRKDAFARAVPADVEIVDGVNPPAPATVIDPALSGPLVIDDDDGLEINPHFESAEGGEHRVGGEFDSLMNLDGIDEQEHLSGYGQEYANGQGGQANFY